VLSIVAKSVRKNTGKHIKQHARLQAIRLPRNETFYTDTLLYNAFTCAILVVVLGQCEVGSRFVQAEGSVEASSEIFIRIITVLNRIMIYSRNTLPNVRNDV
jgi:hypothetical protein